MLCSPGSLPTTFSRYPLTRSPSSISAAAALPSASSRFRYAGSAQPRATIRAPLTGVAVAYSRVSTASSSSSVASPAAITRSSSRRTRAATGRSSCCSPISRPPPGRTPTGPRSRCACRSPTARRRETAPRTPSPSVAARCPARGRPAAGQPLPPQRSPPPAPVHTWAAGCDDRDQADGRGPWSRAGTSPDALLREQCLDRPQPAFVIRRGQVLGGRDPLDRVPELVDVVDPAGAQHPVQRVDPRLPVSVERLAVAAHRDRPETALPADIVNPAPPAPPGGPYPPRDQANGVVTGSARYPRCGSASQRGNCGPGGGPDVAFPT